MQGNQIMSVISDQGFISKEILSHIGGDAQHIRSKVVYCDSAQKAVDTLSSKLADFVLVLSEDESPIKNVIEYIFNFNFENKSLPIVLYFKVQD